jgi:putative hydrolase
MPDGDPLKADLHVHSTFSDGRNTIEENVEEAEGLGLWALTCVDHVRVGTDWVPEYAAAVKRVAAETPVRLRCGIEAKLLDTSGRLDMPDDLPDGVDVVYAADHQVPMRDGTHHPREVKVDLQEGRLREHEVLEDIVTSTINALTGHRQVVIAHLFSILPKIGLDEANVPLDLIERLAEATARTGAIVEVSERWRCPSVRTLRPFLEAGATIVASTDSHRRETIGRYEYCAEVLGALGVVNGDRPAEGAG